MNSIYSVNYVNEVGALQSVVFYELESAVDFYNNIELKVAGQSKTLWRLAECSLDDVILMRSTYLEVFNGISKKISS